MLRANPVLLGLPAGAGRLAFREVQAVEQGEAYQLVVVFEQRVGEGDDASVPGAAVRFVFDGGSRLMRIDNRTRIAPEPSSPVESAAGR